MFINLSNHPSGLWEQEQVNMACRYGTIVDLPFPAVPAEKDEAYVVSLARQYARSIIERYCPETDVVHVMGEMCFSFALVRQLREAGFTCVASTSERKVEDKGNGHKEVYFNFVRFRRYE